MLQTSVEGPPDCNPVVDRMIAIELEDMRSYHSR
jgi:hypothetical protein